MVLTFSLAVLLGLCAPRTAGAFLAAPPLRPPSSYFFPSPSLRAVSQPTELPDSYEQSLEWMASDALTALDKGVSLLRIDFDTSGGDETYTSLKQSLPMVQALLSSMAQEAVEKWTPSGGAAFSGDLEQSPTLRVFFPDQGTAALLERDWKMGTDEAIVPHCVRVCGMTRDKPAPTDAGILILCPQNSEADDTVRILALAEEAGQFVILVNPALVNMGTTGYGLAGRRIRNLVLSKFTTVYYLRTLEWGAVSRRFDKEYAVWQEDPAAEGGYRLLRSLPERPTMMDLDEIYEEENGLGGESEGSSKMLNAFSDFVRDFGRL